MVVSGLDSGRRSAPTISIEEVWWWPIYITRDEGGECGEYFGGGGLVLRCVLNHRVCVRCSLNKQTLSCVAFEVETWIVVWYIAILCAGLVMLHTPACTPLPACRISPKGIIPSGKGRMRRVFEKDDASAEQFAHTRYWLPAYLSPGSMS